MTVVIFYVFDLRNISAVLQDLLKTTPVEHKDFAALQEALRLSQSFLSGVNESSQSKREVTLTHGMVSPHFHRLCSDEQAVDLKAGRLSCKKEKAHQISMCLCLFHQRRQLMRDGFVVDVSEGVRSLRHLFLYTDLLLCTRFKHAARG